MFLLNMAFISSSEVENNYISMSGEAMNEIYIFFTSRGIIFSHRKKFLAWVNEENHLRIITMQQVGDLAEV